MNQLARGPQEAIDWIGQIAGHLFHPLAVGLRVDPGDVHTAGLQFDHEEDEIPPNRPSQASAPGSGHWRPPWRCGRLCAAVWRVCGRGGGIARRGPAVGVAVSGSRPPGVVPPVQTSRPTAPPARVSTSTVNDVVAVEDGAALVAGQEHGDSLGHAGADQVAGGGAGRCCMNRN